MITTGPPGSTKSNAAAAHATESTRVVRLDRPSKRGISDCHAPAVLRATLERKALQYQLDKIYCCLAQILRIETKSSAKIVF